MTNKIIIDAENSIFGRTCSYAAKQALQGNEIIIINCEKAVITGNKKNIIKRYSTLKNLGGTSQKGPKRSRLTPMMFKRSIRGMLPDFRWGEGRESFKRIMCYEGIPKEYEKDEKVKIPGTRHDKFIELKELSKKI